MSSPPPDDFSPIWPTSSTTLPIVLTPLRDRPEDIPALVETLTRDLLHATAARAGHLQPCGARATAAVSLVRQHRRARGGAQRAPSRSISRASSRPSNWCSWQKMLRARWWRGRAHRRSGLPARPSDSLAGLDLEVVLGELAHELRNPMVTIKTFAQHLDSVLADPEVRARFSALTADAIDRMDGLLETLARFLPLPGSGAAADRRAGDLRSCARRARRRAGAHGTSRSSGTAWASDPSMATKRKCMFALAQSVPRARLRSRAAHTDQDPRCRPGVVEMRVRTETSIAARLAAWVEPRSQWMRGGDSAVGVGARRGAAGAQWRRR